MRYLIYPELRARGITYTREHIRRLESVGKFPMHFDLDPNGHRIAWETILIDRWLADKAKANAKAAKLSRIRARQYTSSKGEIAA